MIRLIKGLTMIFYLHPSLCQTKSCFLLLDLSCKLKPVGDSI